MDIALWKITCAPECGFAVQSHDKQEVKDIASTHAKVVHDKTATDSEMEKWCKKYNR